MREPNRSYDRRSWNLTPGLLANYDLEADAAGVSFAIRLEHLRRHAQTKASMWSGWRDGGGPACHLLLDPDHHQNPIRSFPRVSLAGCVTAAARQPEPRRRCGRSWRGGPTVRFRTFRGRRELSRCAISQKD